MLFTFTLVMLTFIVFKADSIEIAFNYYRHLFSKSLFSIPKMLPAVLLIFVILFIVMEWLGRNKEYPIKDLFIEKPKVIRWVFYYILLIIIFVFAGLNQNFIYFQF